MVTTRILDRRRLAGPGRARSTRRRSRSISSGVAARLQVDTFGAVYAVSALIVACLVLYLLVVAQATKASYEIGQLKAEQAQLQAQQQQLRYQEASLTAPSRIEQEASATGMRRVLPSRYVAYQPVQVDLLAPLHQDRPVVAPLWQRAVAAVFRAVGAREAFAAVAH